MSRDELKIFGLKTNPLREDCLLPGLNVRYCQGLFDFAPIPMALLSRDLRWIKVNGKLCELLDYSEDELIGKESAEVSHPKDIGPDRAMMKTLIKRDHCCYSIVKRFLTKTGKTVWCDIHILGIYNINETEEELGFAICWINPIPNNGNFKIVPKQSNKIEYRSNLSLPEFIFDNWKYFVPIGTGLIAIIYWFAKQYHIWQSILEKLGIKP